MARGMTRVAVASLSLVAGILWLMTDVAGQGPRPGTRDDRPSEDVLEADLHRSIADPRGDRPEVS